MKLSRYSLALACVALLNIEPGCGNGDTGVGTQNGPTPLDVRDVTRNFVLQDNFEPETGSVYLRPTVPPSHIHDYVLHQYDRDKAVRSMMAIYFLRYDARLLSKGLISADFREGDLIALLWDKEAARGFAQAESPGMSAMRQHIRNSSEWFGLDANTRKLLRSNEVELKNLYGTGSAK